MRPAPGNSVAYAAAGTPAGAFKGLVGASDPWAWSYSGGWGRSYLPNAAGYDFSRHDLSANSVVAIALSWLRRNIHKGRIVCGNEQADGTYAETPGHPLVDLLRQPNPGDSWKATLGATCDCLSIDGNAYWLKARNRLDGTVEEVYWVPNHQIQVEPEGDPVRQIESGPVRGYWHQVGSYRRFYPRAEVVHFRDGIDPLCRWKGLSDLKRQVRNAASVDFGERYTAAVLRNAHAGKALAPRDVVGGVVQGSPDEATMDALARKIEAGVAGEDAGRVIKSSLPVDLIDLGMGPEAMLIDRILDRPEAFILAALGLNALCLGLPSSKDVSTYANKGEARRECWENAVIPRQDLIGDEVEAQLLPDFPTPAADSVWWDRRDVEALREDANERAQRSQLVADIATLNERRGMVDLAPVDGGDETPVEKAAAAAEQAQAIADGMGGPDRGAGADAPARDGAANGRLKSLFDLGPIDFEAPPGDGGGVATKAAPGATGKAHWITVWSRRANRFVHVRVEGDRHARGQRRVTAVRKGSPADLEAGVERAKAETGLDLHAEHGPPRGPAERKFAEKAHAAGKAAVVAEARPIVRVESAGDATRYHVGGRLTREVRPVRGDDPGAGARDRFAITSRGQRGEVDHEGYHATREAAEAAARRSAETIADEEGSIHSGRHATRLAVADLASHDYADAAYHDPHWTTTFRLLTGP